MGRPPKSTAAEGPDTATALLQAAAAEFVEHGYDKAMGARPMARIVQNTLKAPLANEILFGKLANGGTAFVDVKDGQIDIRCEPDGN